MAIRGYSHPVCVGGIRNNGTHPLFRAIPFSEPSSRSAMPATHHANQIMQRLLKPANPVADIAVMHQAVLEAIRNSGVVPSMPQVISRLMEAISDPEFKYAAVGPCAISAGLAASRFGISASVGTGVFMVASIA